MPGPVARTRVAHLTHWPLATLRGTARGWGRSATCPPTMTPRALPGGVHSLCRIFFGGVMVLGSDGGSPLQANGCAMGKLRHGMRVGGHCPHPSCSTAELGGKEGALGREWVEWGGSAAPLSGPPGPVHPPAPIPVPTLCPCPHPLLPTPPCCHPPSPHPPFASPPQGAAPSQPPQ